MRVDACGSLNETNFVYGAIHEAVTLLIHHWAYLIIAVAAY